MNTRSSDRRRDLLVLTVLTFLPIFTGLTGGICFGSGNTAITTVCVMAPLTVPSSGMAEFENVLTEAKAIGVTCVSVDVWWGLVEKNGDQNFDWSYYDNVFNRIKNKGLKIIPIISFHKCGGGPGDNCDIPLPGWLWNHFATAGLSDKDLKHESETGKVQDDAIVPWITEKPAVLAEFTEFMEEFESHFANMAGDFGEINISLGPTGELRYPSYSASDGWSYPERGHFQCYSDFAQEHFRNWALSKFGGLSGVSNRWGIPLGSSNDIRVPGGHLPDNSGKRAQTFVGDNDHNDTVYGRDFIDWYNESLVGHGKRLLLAANSAFNDSMGSISLGVKIPGIHWQMQCTPTPRIAEITAGLVQTTLNLQPIGAARAVAYGYKNIMDMIVDVKGSTGRDVILHFTAIEMDNDANCGIGTSMAEALVFWISHGAEDRGITLKGENALGCIGDVEGDPPHDIRSWDKIRNAFDYGSYSGFTMLRLSTVSDNFGCVAWNSGDKTRYQSFIKDYAQNNGTGTVIVHLAEWQFCPENQGCNYSIHTWDGMSGNFALSYEGLINGKHWWKGKIPNATDSFKFTFNNSNGWEGNIGQFDRTYSRSSHGNEIFALGRSNTAVYTSRP